MNKIKSKIGLKGYLHLFTHLTVYSSIVFLLLNFSKLKINHSIDLYFRIFIFSLSYLTLPLTIFFYFFYYNSFLEIDTENKLVRVRKLFRKYKTIKLKGDERYIVRKILGRRSYDISIYVIDDEKVIFTYQNVFNSNWDELKEGLNNMGINEVSYDGTILFRDLFKMKL